MSNTRCQVYNHLLTPLFAIVTAVYFRQFDAALERQVLIVYTAMAVAAHVHYGACVVRQLADHFNIYAFSTQKKAAHAYTNGDSKHK